jgi:HEAT repeat protein
MAPRAGLALLALVLSGPVSGHELHQSAAQRKASQSATNRISTPASSPSSQEKTLPDPIEESWQILSEGLHSRRVSRRVEAVKALSLLSESRQAIRFSLRALQDKNPRVRASAAASLGELHATNSAPALRAALSDKDVSVMLAATYALYLLKDHAAYEVYYAILMGDKKTSQGSIQAQIDRLKDPRQVAQMGFQEGLGFVPYGGMGYEAYRAILKHDNSPLRAAAARYLALDPDSVSEDALIQAAVADKNIIVRQAALDALAQRHDVTCIARLEKNLQDDKYPVRYRTAATIIHITGKDSSRRKPG